MFSVSRFLKFQVVSEPTAKKIAEIACYVAAIGIFALGARRLAVLELSEAGLLIGLLMIVAVAVLFVVAGLLMRSTQSRSNTPQ